MYLIHLFHDRPLVFLYGAGLRISEAVALTVADVDSRSTVITIRNTKFHKTTENKGRHHPGNKLLTSLKDL